jgi:hypothetical protein
MTVIKAKVIGVAIVAIIVDSLLRSFYQLMSLQVYVSVAVNNKNLFNIHKHTLHTNKRQSTYKRNNGACFATIVVVEKQ